MVRVNELTISEILRGMEPGKLQTVGIMQVLPLLGNSDLYDADLISPSDEAHQATTGTSNYGSMEFDNSKNDKVLLVPCHVGYVTSQRAQDHAMAHAGLVDKKKRRTFDTAMCVQQTQGGMISKGQHKMLILPYSLRERALQMRDQKEYGKLWNDISTFNRELGLRTGDRGHLEYFLDHFRKELDQFVAEFECIPQQCGAIILINGQVVGVERAPNPTFWRDVWSPLVRECYGSLAIQVGRQTGPNAVPKTRVPLSGGRINSLDDLEKALTDREEKQDEKAREIIRKLLDEPFTSENEETMKKYTVVTIKNGQFLGQLVKDETKISYASLFTTKDWAKSAPWRQTSKFTV